MYWYERRGKGVFVAATPIDVSSILREQLFDAFDTIVMTSATLAVGGRFDFLKQRLGIHTARERVLPHEFDFRRQALLYIPPRLPDVRDAGFAPRRPGDCSLLECTEGRAFCLFTSYSQMNQIFELVRADSCFPLFLQGTAPRMALLGTFRTHPARFSSPPPASGRAWTFPASSFPA